MPESAAEIALIVVGKPSTVIGVKWTHVIVPFTGRYEKLYP